MRICVYEDLSTHQLEPLSLCRPVFDLWCGAGSLLDRQRRLFPRAEVGALVRPLLADYTAALHPELAVNRQEWLHQGVHALINARWLAPACAPTTQAAHVGMIADQVAYVALPPADLAECTPGEIAEFVEDCKQSLPQREAGGRMIDFPWHLLEYNGEALEEDVAQRADHGIEANHVAVIGPRDRLIVEAGARVDPWVVADVSNGPVVIESGAIVHSFTTLEGPCLIGRDSYVLGAKIRASTIGPICRVGGEVEASIIQGYSNKAHDGFLGHSYLGEWVNLGAGTQTSDLRNDYGPVSVVMGGKKVNTRLTKVGSFIGDHSKTGLNTLLNTGSIVGPFCHLLASSNYCPRVVPAFCTYGHGQLQDRPDFGQLFATAAAVMQRRQREWTPRHAEYYLALYDYTTTARRQVLWESEQHRLRRIV